MTSIPIENDSEKSLEITNDDDNSNNDNKNKHTDYNNNSNNNNSNTSRIAQRLIFLNENFLKQFNKFVESFNSFFLLPPMPPRGNTSRGNTPRDVTFRDNAPRGDIRDGRSPLKSSPKNSEYVFANLDEEVTEHSHDVL